MSLTSGGRIGPYEILTTLGAGGMGEVYKARDTRIDRTVAVKVLTDQSDPDLRARFEREARAIGALNHPHICTLHDIGTHEGRDFLVLEFVDGETLATRLARGPLPPAQVIEFATQIADALDKAHRAGIVHRDLKPGNVMLTKSGVKLLDFGLAKARAAVSAGPTIDGVSAAPTNLAPLTGRGTILGTLHYMAPEQLEGREADARTDTFALGLVIYEMATGRRAFEGRSHASLVGAILKDDPPAMSAIQPMTPAALERIVRTCLAKEPDDRFQSAHDVLIELRWALEPLAATAIPTAAASAPGSRLRSRLALALGALAIAAGAGTFGYLLAGGRTPAPRTVRFQIAAPAGWQLDNAVALSPDSRHITFVAERERRSQLWLRPVDADAPRALPGTEGAIFPFWSPDSQAIAFFADGKLKRISVAGGPPIVICDAGPSGRGGTWTVDGTILFAPHNASPIMKVSAAGGEPASVTTLDQTRGDVSHRFPHFLPDGRRFLFFGMTKDPSKGGLRLASLDAPERSAAVVSGGAADYANGYLFFSRDGDLLAQRFDAGSAALVGDPVPIAERIANTGIIGRMAFSASATGGVVFRGQTFASTQLTWMSRSGQTLATVGDPAVQGFPEVSPDGKRVAVARADGDAWDLWLLDDTRGTTLRVTADAHDDVLPVWSPDGARLAFASNRGPSRNTNLYETPSDGGGDIRPIVEGNALMNPAGWTPDGRAFVWGQSDARTLMSVWTMRVDVDGERKPVRFLTAGFTFGQPQLSRDGRWIAYVSNPTGRFEVYVQRYPTGGGTRQVSTAGGLQPRWRPDGREIFFLSLENRLMAAEVTPADQIEFGAPKPLFEVRVPVYTTNNSRAEYAVSPDGSRLLVNRIHRDATSEITTVLNWSPAGVAR